MTGPPDPAYVLFGMVVTRRRNELFRRRVAGFGSCEPLVKTGGANAQSLEGINVLFVGSIPALVQP